MIKNQIPENKLEKINLLWQRSTGLLGPVIITLMVLMLFDQNSFDLFSWLLWLHLPLVMFHEFEEYIFPGGFKNFFNTYTPFSKETPTQDNLPINEVTIFVVNIGVWVWIIMGALLAEVVPWLGVSAAIFQIVNVMGHIFLFQIKKPGYNPGLITTLFLLIPYIVVLTWVSITQDMLDPREWIWAFVIGFGNMATMIIKANFSRAGKQKSNNVN